MKSLINSALFKEQLKRLSPIMIVSILFYFAIILMPIHSGINNMHINGRIWNIQHLIDLIGMRAGAMFVYTIPITLLMVGLNFTYLFSPKTTTTIHSYPINKNQLFFTNVLVGLTILVIPLLLFSIVLVLTPVQIISTDTVGFTYHIPVNLFPNGIEVGDTINTFSRVAGFFFRWLLIIVFYYALFLTALMLSGHAAIYIAMAGFVSLFPLAIYSMWEGVLNFFSFGYANLLGGFLYDIEVIRYTHPTTWGALFNQAIYETYNFTLIRRTSPELVASNVFPYIISYIVIGIVLFCIAFFCNKKRMQEYAGHSIVFKPITKILICLISLIGMMFFAIFYLALLQNMVVMYIALVIGFIITYFVSQMIAQQSINIFRRSIKELPVYGGLALGSFLFCVVFIQHDLIGIARHVPNEEDIVGVSIRNHLNHFDGPDWLLDHQFVSDPQIIEDILFINRTIIQNKSSLRPVFLRSFNNVLSEEYMWVTINFRLENGSIFSRRYVLPIYFAEDIGLVDLMHTREVLLSQQDIFAIPSEYTNELRINLVRGAEWESILNLRLNDIDEINSFMEVLEKDAVVSAQVNLFEDLDDDQIHLSAWINMGRNHHHNSQIHWVNPSIDISISEPENVVAWLVERGHMEER